MPSILPAVRPSRLRASLDASVAEGAAAEVFGACAGGAVLTGWALFLGASPVVIGLLGALPLAAQMVQVPAAWLTQRIGARPLAIVSIGAARLAWLPLVAVPFLHLAPATALMVFIGVVALAAVLGVVGNNAWTAWMGDLVPGPVRGRFLARRMVYLNVAGTVASLAAGCALDAFAPRGWKGETLGVLAAVACVAGIVSIRLMLAQQSPRRRDDTAPDWGDVARAVREPQTRPLLWYLLGWNAAVGISAGFFSFHMLANLEMAFTLVAAHAIIVAALRIVSAPACGRLVERHARAVPPLRDRPSRRRGSRAPNRRARGAERARAHARADGHRASIRSAVAGGSRRSLIGVRCAGAGVWSPSAANAPAT